MQAANDACRQRAVEAERVADGKHLLSDDELVRVAQGHDGHLIARRFNLDDGQVCVGIAADDFRRVSFIAAETDGEFLRSLDNVIVGQDVPLIVYHGA